MITSPARGLRVCLAAATAAALGAGVLTATASTTALAADAGPDPAVAGALQDVGGGGAALITPREGVEVPRPRGLSRAADESETARAYLATVAPALGVEPDDDALRDRGTAELFDGSSVTRYQQYVDGLPVLGGQLVVALDGDGRLESAGGETASRLDDPRVQLLAERAVGVAVRAAADALDLDAAALGRLAEPRKYVNDPAVTGLGTGGSHVVWRVAVGPGGLGTEDSAVVLVDARDGAVVSVTPRARHAANRAVCDRGNVRAYTWGSDAACDGVSFGGYARTEGQPAVGSSQVDGAYDNLGHVHDFYREVLGTDLVTGSGFPRLDGTAWSSGDGEKLRASVRYCMPASASRECARYGAMFNAFWLPLDEPEPGLPYPGGAMFIGDGLAPALDVIAHEMAHGVSDAISGLVYEDESGAINESMSDVLGELNEQWVRGPDATWLIGQDAVRRAKDGLGVLRSLDVNGLRSMSSPASFVCNFGGDLFDCRQPDSMRSGFWDADLGRLDHGGVHTNSGVGNKAAYLMTRGGTFGGRTVAPLSASPERAILKTARLWWKAQHLLTPYADYHDLARVLNQSCASLVAAGASVTAGATTEPFTSSNCSASVASATLATAMGATKLSVELSSGKVAARERVAATVRLQGYRGSTIGGAVVELQRRVVGTSTWRTVERRRTSAAGRADVAFRATRRADFRAVYAPGGGIPTTASAARYLAVKAAVGRKVRKKKLRAGQRLVVRGKVRPASAGRKVKLQARLDGRWRTQTTARVRASSKYRFRHRPRAATHGTTSWRVLKPRQKNLGKGASKTFRTRIR